MSYFFQSGDRVLCRLTGRSGTVKSVNAGTCTVRFDDTQHSWEASVVYSDDLEPKASD